MLQIQDKINVAGRNLNPVTFRYPNSWILAPYNKSIRTIIFHVQLSSNQDVTTGKNIVHWESLIGDVVLRMVSSYGLITRFITKLS